ncbi:hypothetical protein BHE74_00041052 [Ensete ventricosum]|nr:hypothetical protein BHE74_00041052 [Ensete ventricosum]
MERAMERALEDLIAGLPGEDQEIILRNWLEDFAASDSDWPNLQRCFHRWECYQPSGSRMEDDEINDRHNCPFSHGSDSNYVDDGRLRCEIRMMGTVEMGELDPDPTWNKPFAVLARLVLVRVRKSVNIGGDQNFLWIDVPSGVLDGRFDQCIPGAVSGMTILHTGLFGGGRG